MTVARGPRLALVTILVLVLAVGLGAQALSSVSTRAAPEQAVSLFPANGLARERLAFIEFTVGVTDPEDASKAAQAASNSARAAMRTVALAPKAHAILAMAASDDDTRREILEIASRLNRRDLTLQSLILQEHIAEADYPATIATLDQLLRVHPERSREFFPVLVSALTREEAVPLFAEMLDGSSAWHNRFLNFAVKQPEALPNLALLRHEIFFDDEDLDRALVTRFAALSDIEAAENLYRHVTGSDSGVFNQGVLDWRADYPPFEWLFVDQPGFRAQRSRKGNQLELAVRPGKGGPIAARLIKAPESPFAIRIKHRIAPVEKERDVRLQLTCEGRSNPFYDERFSRQGEGFRIDSLPSDCQFIVLAINPRAWSGRSALSGTVDQIEVVELD